MQGIVLRRPLRSPEPMKLGKGAARSRTDRIAAGRGRLLHDSDRDRIHLHHGAAREPIHLHP